MYISLLNVVSCIAVVFLHTNGCFWAYSTERYWKTANVIECLAYFAVPCFFMISGATLLNYRDRYSLKEYFGKRVQKTLVPFLAWSMIGLLYRLAITKSIQLSDVSALYVYNGIMNSSFVDIYWFFTSQFCIYLSIPLFAAVEKSARKEIFSYLAIIGLVLNSAIPLIQKVLFPDMAWKISVATVSGYLIYVVIGYLINEYPMSRKQRLIIYGFSIAGFLMHLLGTYYASTEAGTVISTYKGYANVPTILYSVGVFVWFRYHGEEILKIAIIRKAILLVSEYAFGIYLIHWFVIRALNRIINIGNTSIAYRLGMPFLVVPLSIAIIWVLRKIPVVKRIVP